MSKLAEIKCGNIARREDVLADPVLNGIDYIEVPRDDQRNIRVYFIKPAPPSLSAGSVTVEGGVRITNIRVLELNVKTDGSGNQYLEVKTDQAGDFSTYVLVIDSAALDVAFSRYPFSFKAGCPSDFDCCGRIICPPPPQSGPEIDYMAKDYLSFRNALLDYITLVIPDWKERHEADLGIAIVDLLSYAGDQLSYYQDAAANEAYLETARQRESVKRHARLIDYNMHDGADAMAFIQIKISGGTSGTLPAGTSVLSKITVPLGQGNIPPYGPVIASSLSSQALSAAAAVFETVDEFNLDSSLNEIKIHTWNNKLCCVPKGTVMLELEGDLPLHPDDFLLFEEVKGPETGSAADADPEHRQVVRLTGVKKTEDPLGLDPVTGLPPMKLTQVTWNKEDGLKFAMCISVKLPDGTFIDNVSLARGNMVLADHGRTISEWYPADPAANPADPGIELTSTSLRFELNDGPLTFSRTPLIKKCGIAVSSSGTVKPSVKNIMNAGADKAAASVYLEVFEDGPADERPKWCPVPHLLDSKPFDRNFVADIRNNGRALIRFGDDEFGMQPSEGSHFKITYRIGNGAQGNVGSESLVHILEPEVLPASWPDIKGVRNPLPAEGGIDPEKIEQVKLLAPRAFHAEQYRAVTEEDYAEAAEKHPEVDKAVAAFRWTGSWHTVFVTIDPAGRTDVSDELKVSVQNHLLRYKLAGYDMEINSPIYVSLEIEINICAARDYFRAHVKEAVLEALSNRLLTNGQTGFFHPDNFTFGQSVYLSRLYERIEEVQGVDSAEVIVFKRHAETENHELEKGRIIMGELEIARLDNDPSFPENGILRLNMRGGR